MKEKQIEEMAKDLDSIYKKVYRKEYANQKLKSNYCPNCGAKMKGKHND